MGSQSMGLSGGGNENVVIGGDVIGRSIVQLRSETSPSTTIRYRLTDVRKPGYYYLDAADVTSADDGVMTLVSGTLRFKRIIVGGFISPSWWNVFPDGSDSSPGLQAMWDWVGSHPASVYSVVFSPGDYTQLSQVNLPGRISTPAESIHVQVIGYGVRITSPNAITLWARMPTTQTQALDLYIANWICHIKGFVFDGQWIVGSRALRFGAMYSWTIEDCNFNYWDEAVQMEFALSCRYINLRFAGNVKHNFTGRFGTWTGATESNSAFNACILENIRVGGASGALTHFNLTATNGVECRTLISEGAKPVTNFVLESNASAVIKNNSFENIWIECNGGSVVTSTNFRIRGRGTTYVKKVHLDYPDILFDSTGTSGTIVFDGIHFIGALPTPCFNAGSVGQTLGYNLKFANIGGGGPVFRNKLYNATSWVDGVIPIELFYIFEEASGSGQTTLTSGGSIQVEPGSSSGGGGGAFIDKGHFWFYTDNVYEIGASTGGALNTRPVRVTVGTGGVSIDKTAKARWAKAGEVPTVELSQPIDGVMQVESTGAVQMPYGTIAQRPVSSAASHKARVRFNDEMAVWEYFDGAIWRTIANGWQTIVLANNSPIVVPWATFMDKVYVYSNIAIPALKVGYTINGSEIGTVNLLANTFQEVVLTERWTPTTGGRTIYYSGMAGTEAAKAFHKFDKVIF